LSKRIEKDSCTTRSLSRTKKIWIRPNSRISTPRMTFCGVPVMAQITAAGISVGPTKA